jgi:hypothetical protein
MHLLWIGLSLLWSRFHSRDAQAKSNLFTQDATTTNGRRSASGGQHRRSNKLRGQEITPSPKLVAVVGDSVLLARTVMAAIERKR